MSAATKFISSILLQLVSLNFVIANHKTDIQFADIYPKIILSDNVTYITRNVGEDLTIECQCLNHITWRHFNTTILSGADLSNNLHNFESTLHLKNISVHDVGYYYCMLTQTRSDFNLDHDLEYAHELKEASRIYVFIKDPANPLVPITNRNISGKLYSKIILPCKPSSESIEVELSREDGKLIGYTEKDSRKGFTVELIDSSINQSTLICRAMGAVESTFQINVTIEPYVNFINNPWIRRNSGDIVYANAPNFIDLLCQVVVKKSDTIEIEWENGGEEMPRNRKIYKGTQNHQNSSELEILWARMTIENAWYKESRLYNCTVRNTVTNVRSNRSTFVDIWFKYKPVLTAIQDYYIKAGEKVTVDCKCQAYPSCSIHWTYQRCQPSEISNCSLAGEVKDFQTATNETRIDTYNDIVLISTMQFEPPSSGILRCIAENFDRTITNISIWLDDLDTPFGIDKTNLTEPVLIRDNVTVTCVASIYNHTDVDWYRDSRQIESNEDYEVIRSDTKYSIRKQLTIKNILTPGLYECRTIFENTGALRIDALRTGFSDRKFVKIIPRNPQLVDITDAKDSEQYLNHNDKLELHCNASGMPEPKITWFKDNKVIQNGNNTLIKFNMTQQNDGTYECRATNRLNSVRKRTRVFVRPQPDWTTLISILTIALALLLCFVIYTSVRLHRARKVNKDWEYKWANNWEKGKPEKLNPNLTLGEQAEFLPYDKEKYDIPRDDVQLDDILGSGEFGEVRKALARINENFVTVAVKETKTKNVHDYEETEVLASELKIMSNLKEHLNIVNLLAAVTENFAKREFMIVMEYCEYGNLRDILRSNRIGFIDQFNPTTNKLDPSISTSEQYCNGYEPIPRGYSSLPEGKTNINTSDLILWSFQVARGMQFLSENNVLHGDLAARNVLLYADNVVKICDFGLSRLLDKDKNYIKMGRKIPYKLLPPEYLMKGIYNTATDVWSFGILLWEIFSLGEEPYADFHNCSSLLIELLTGYRMDKPSYANHDLYRLMSECWENDSEDRTTFQNLQNNLVSMLPDVIVANDLNQIYTYQKWIENFFKKKVQAPPMTNVRQSLLIDCDDGKDEQKKLNNFFFACIKLK